ncbi:MAG: PQQ-dependent dehydrogenase, methanol/ethanol family [Gammaproteobacteria bacterium]|nr:PQQ-dependent dehydrogenase, methanol/ethanol family [Gammaproteobacteria bacterium]
MRACGAGSLGIAASAAATLLAVSSLALAQEHAQWPAPAGDFANTRFSALTDINATNVASLKLNFAFSTGMLRGHEAAPIVTTDTMYIVTPYPNVLLALALDAPGAPLRWKYESLPNASSQGVACCDTVNRGAAYADGRVFFNTLDGQSIAVDARSGKEIWRTHLADINHGESITMAPLVVNGKVLVGNSGGEFGVRGWLTALDAATGKLIWRAYSTGPDSEVLIGPDFKPFYAQDRGQDLGVHSWPPDAWQRGGGTVWGWISYDPELNLIFYGTANPGPWNPDQRPGDNKWTAGIFARNPDTGAAKWFYQMSPHDLYDYDGVNENVLLDLDVGGRQRKVLAHADRNGYLYVIDRATGEVISANAFVHVNTIDKVDLATGRPHYVAEKKPVVGQVVRDICPHAGGGKDWQPSAYSPITRYLYIPHQNLCQDEEAVPANYIAGTPYVGANIKMHAGPGGNRGVFSAWDVAVGRSVWEIKENFPVWSGALATAGGLAFYGTMEGWFKAVDARTGRLLWQFKAGSGIIGQPIAYRGPDGKEYVAVLAGVGGWAGGVVSGDFDTRDASAGNGWGNAMADLPKFTQKGGTLYVFSLP